MNPIEYNAYRLLNMVCQTKERESNPNPGSDCSLNTIRMVFTS